MILGPVSDVSTPEWKQMAFVALMLAAGLIIFLRRSKLQEFGAGKWTTIPATASDKPGYQK